MGSSLLCQQTITNCDPKSQDQFPVASAQLFPPPTTTATITVIIPEFYNLFYLAVANLRDQSLHPFNKPFQSPLQLTPPCYLRPQIHPFQSIHPPSQPPATMSDTTETKPTPSADQTASSDLRPAQDETKLVQDPLGKPETEAPNPTSSSLADAASSAASAATSTATGVKDSVFSMFGGGAKKEKKIEEEDEAAKNEPSGSSKAKKEDDDDVRHSCSSPNASTT